MESSTTSNARMTAFWSINMAASTACSASSEYGGRRSRYGSRPGGLSAIEYSTGELDIFPGGALPGGIPQQSRGMVGHDQRHPVIAMNLAPQLTDRELGFKQRLRGEGCKGQNDLGPHQLDLAHQIGRAGGHLLRQRIPVARRPVLEDVRDEDIVTRQLDRPDDLRQQLPRRAHEGLALLVLVGARGLADDH